MPGCLPGSDWNSLSLSLPTSWRAARRFVESHRIKRSFRGAGYSDSSCAARTDGCPGRLQASTPKGRHSDQQLQVLRWIYGGLVCTQNLEFLERQAEVPPPPHPGHKPSCYPMDCTAALLKGVEKYPYPPARPPACLSLPAWRIAQRL